MAGRVRYPSATVTCSPISWGTDIVPDPVVVAEVISAGTECASRVVRNAEYRATPSIRHYVILEQTVQAATVFSREGDDWLGRLLTGDAVLALPAIRVELPLGELYAGVEFADDVEA